MADSPLEGCWWGSCADGDMTENRHDRTDPVGPGSLLVSGARKI